MCMDHAIQCKCGAMTARLQFKDSLVPPEIITTLSCPSCAANADFDEKSMVLDNGWVLEFNMEMAGFILGKQALPSGGITPEYLFDEGYATWRGMTPTDALDALHERERILKYAKTDPKRYFAELRNWGQERMSRLGKEGWRKAREEACVCP